MSMQKFKQFSDDEKSNFMWKEFVLSKKKKCSFVFCGPMSYIVFSVKYIFFF